MFIIFHGIIVLRCLFGTINIYCNNYLIENIIQVLRFQLKIRAMARMRRLDS